jgi:hypothetical protein
MYGGRWQQLIQNRDALPFVEVVSWNDYGESSVSRQNQGGGRGLNQVAVTVHWASVWEPASEYQLRQCYEQPYW